MAEYRWREVILLLLGIVDERYCTYLTENILAAGDAQENPSNRQLPVCVQLAADALANQAPMSRELQEEIVGRLENIAKVPALYASSSDRALRALGAIGHIPEIITAALGTITNDPAVDAWARVEAARQLEQFGAKTSATSSLASIVADPAIHAGLRAQAATELARLGERTSAIATLTDVADDLMIDDRGRMEAACALGQLGERAVAISVLTPIATNPSGERLD